MHHLLYLAHRLPYPPNKGDKVRTFNELKYLSQRYRVHLGAFIDDPADWEHIGSVQRFCASTYFARLNATWAKIRSARGLLTGEALTLPYYRHRGLAAWVQATIARNHIRHAIAYSSSMSQYLIGLPGIRRVANIADVDSDKWRQYASTQSWPMSWVYAREARTLSAFENRLARELDATVLHAPHEAEFLRRQVPDAAERIHHSSNGVDSEYFSPVHGFANPYQRDELGIVFTGAMDYWPNIDAVEWFADAIYASVRRRLPAARFYIVGARPAARLERLQRLGGITVTGGVPDVRPYLAHAALAVAPLRIARGIQNKVLEAMAMAKPVVVSPHAAAGIVAEPGREFVIASGAGEFADAVCRLLTDCGRDAVGNAARERVLKRYSWSASVARVEALMLGTA